MRRNLFKKKNITKAPIYMLFGSDICFWFYKFRFVCLQICPKMFFPFTCKMSNSISEKMWAVHFPYVFYNENVPHTPFKTLNFKVYRVNFILHMLSSCLFWLSLPITSYVQFGNSNNILDSLKYLKWIYCSRMQQIYFGPKNQMCNHT